MRTIMSAAAVTLTALTLTTALSGCTNDAPELTAPSPKITVHMQTEMERSQSQIMRLVKDSEGYSGGFWDDITVSEPIKCEKPNGAEGVYFTYSTSAKGVTRSDLSVAAQEVNTFWEEAHYATTISFEESKGYSIYGTHTDASFINLSMNKAKATLNASTSCVSP